MRFKGDIVLVGSVEVEAGNPQEARDKIRDLFRYKPIEIGPDVQIDERAVLSGKMRSNGMLSNHIEEVGLS